MPEPLASTRLGRAARLVILISGSGTLLQALSMPVQIRRTGRRSWQSGQIGPTSKDWRGR